MVHGTWRKAIGHSHPVAEWCPSGNYFCLCAFFAIAVSTRLRPAHVLARHNLSARSRALPSFHCNSNDCTPIDLFTLTTHCLLRFIFPTISFLRLPYLFSRCCHRSFRSISYGYCDPCTSGNNIAQRSHHARNG